MNARRLILILAAAAAVLLALAYAWRTTSERGPVEDQVHAAAPTVAIGGPFQLTDQDGRPVDQTALNGKWSAVFFGFTHCPDVCPGTLQALNAAAGQLGPKARDFQIVFVSVDTQRDNPEQMKAYLEAQDLAPGTLGLTGTPGQIAAVAKAYRTYYALEGEGDALNVTHMNTVYLMDPQGRFSKPLNYGLSPEQMADLIRDAMKS